MTSANRPTPKQQNYLRRLARETGTSFTPPQTRRDASNEIKRLLKLKGHGFTFAERQAHEHQNDRALPTAAAVQDFEVTGWGSTATWSERS